MGTSNEKPALSAMTGVEAVVSALRANGVDTVFGLPRFWPVHICPAGTDQLKNRNRGADQGDKEVVLDSARFNPRFSLPGPSRRVARFD